MKTTRWSDIKAGVPRPGPRKLDRLEGVLESVGAAQPHARATVMATYLRSRGCALVTAIELVRDRNGQHVAQVPAHELEWLVRYVYGAQR